MRVVQPPISHSSELVIDGDFNMLGLYQIGNLAVPAAGEVFRKGQGDIVDADVNAAAAIALTKLASIPGPTIVVKTADQTVNNSAVLVNDNHLLKAIGANEIWLLDLYLLQQSVSIDADFKAGWSYPVGCLIYWGVPRFTTTNVMGIWSSGRATASTIGIYRETDTQDIAALVGTTGLHLIALVVNGANAGNVNFMWAQNAATVEDTKVLANSILIALKLA